MLPILADPAQSQWLEWFLHDPVGQKAGIAIVVVAGLIFAIILFKSMRWAAARANLIIGMAVVIAGVYLLAIFLFQAGPVGWIGGAIVAFGMFLGLALFLTVARR